MRSSLFSERSSYMSDDNIRVLVKMAQLYYEDGATQEEIAQRFNVSRSLVSKYLSRARDMGIIEVIINASRVQPYRQLEEQVKREFGLDEVICVESLDDFESLNRSIGISAAQFLNRIIKDGDVIAVAAGRALSAVANNFTSKIKYPNVKVLPLTGGLGDKHTDIQSNVISEILSQKIGGTFEPLHAPVLVDSPEAKQVFMKQSFIKNIFDQAKKADIAIVGLGGRPAYFEMTNAYLHRIEVEVSDSHSMETAVSDICYHFLDQHGHAFECQWNEQVIALPLEEIRDIPMVIAVAGGPEKHQGILAALGSKVFNVLVTDYDSCRYLLDAISE